MTTTTTTTTRTTTTPINHAFHVAGADLLLALRHVLAAIERVQALDVADYQPMGRMDFYADELIETAAGIRFIVKVAADTIECEIPWEGKKLAGD